MESLKIMETKEFPGNLKMLKGTKGTEGMQGTKGAKETKMVLSNFSKNAPHFNLKDDFALAPNEKFPVGTHFYCMLLSKGSQSILAFFVN